MVLARTLNIESPQRTPIILLLGPTASGKSAAAMALASRFEVEIISVDSACVYRQMDIGTAKPSVEEQNLVPHHLLDCVDPWDAYSAARFATDAHRAIIETRGRNKIPLLVGGTMLYAKALMQGLDDLPSADSAVRERIENEARQHGWPALHARLAELDPPTAARLSGLDAQRISRALEIIELTGRPMSALLSAGARQNANARADAISQTLAIRSKVNNSIAASMEFDWRVIALEPSSRSLLHERIAARFQAMIDQGLIAEVERLRAEPRIHADLPSMRCVGYRQVWEMLDGKLPSKELNERAIAATRQLAKRQLTWLRAMPERCTIDCTNPDGAVAINNQIRQQFERIWNR